MPHPALAINFRDDTSRPHLRDHTWETPARGSRP